MEEVFKKEKKRSIEIFLKDIEINLKERENF